MRNIINKMIRDIKGDDSVLIVSRALEVPDFFECLLEKNITNISLAIYGHKGVQFGMRNKIKNEYKIDVNFIEINDILDEKVKMKFNYIIGNPPYQYPKTGNTKLSKKLFIGITEKSFGLLAPEGKISFVTPRNILVPTKNNTVFPILKNKITSVNFDANDSFDVGQSIIAWEAQIQETQETSQIKVQDDECYYVDDILKIVKKDEKDATSAFYKIWGVTNKRKLTKFNKDRNKVEFDLTKEEQEEHDIPVLDHRKKCEIRYTHKDNIKDLDPQERLLLHYVGRYEEGCILTDQPACGWFYYYYDKDHNHNHLMNAKSYFESNVIMFMVRYFSGTLAVRSTNNAILKIPELDMTRSWSNKELYREFNLSSDEIFAIENYIK